MSYSSLIFPLWKNTAADVCQYLNTKDASKKIHLANSLATQRWHMWDFCWLSIIETQTVQSWMSENLCPSRCTNWWIGTHMYYSWVLLFHIIIRYLGKFFFHQTHPLFQRYYYYYFSFHKLWISSGFFDDSNFRRVFFSHKRGI